MLQWLHERASILRYMYIAGLFFILAHKLNFFGKKALSLQFLPEIFLIIRKFQRDIIINVHRPSRQVLVVLVRF